MKKVLFTTVSILISLVLLSTGVFASDTADIQLLSDGAGLLSDSEAEHLTETLNTLSADYGMSIVIVTTNSLSGKSPETFADDYYDSNGYGEDGVLLLISMEDSDWYISTAGYGITAFTDAGIQYIGDEIVFYLSEGEFYDAFCTFTDLCKSFIIQANTGDPYDTHNLKESFSVFGSLLFSLITGFIAALIVTAVMKGKLKSVRANESASDYVDKDSLRVTNSNEFFLYSNVTRIAKPKDTGGSSQHRSSSGRIHGGGGGKF